MPGIEIPIRTPTSVLFFIAAGVAAYYSIDKPQLVWFAYAAGAFFTSLGPLRWLETTLYSLPLVKYPAKEYELRSHKSAYKLTRLFVALQVGSLLAGLAFLLQGLVRL